MGQSNESSTMSEGSFVYDISMNKNKISNINFLSESTTMMEEKKNQKWEGENFYEDIKIDILRIERNINIEVSKRIEENQNLQNVIENTANKMINNILNKITTKIENISNHLDNINTKCNDLENTVKEIKMNLPSKIQTDMLSLKREINDFHMMINKYIHNKKKRDNIIFSKIENINTYVHGKIHNEISFKEDDFIFLKNESMKLLNYDIDDDINFRNVFLDEIEDIKDALALTVKEREQSDDDIIQAMNKYTSVLQKALQSVITSGR
ncbi:SF-assemblin, putative [Plasmodium ovale]|uniref:SF-assemblin, putative n=1 Tax=Plasmodium ovale TaxID=36330 RepID=A0A1D3TMC1_PLAOA|nr:SF-assemblin, putative [Plasmodium ovale]